MSFIEGIGDEVTVFFVVVFAFVIAALVTLINSRPSVHTIRTRLEQLQRAQNSDDGTPTIILTPEFYTASFVPREPNENQSPIQPQSFNNHNNQNTARNHNENNVSRNLNEDQIVDENDIIENVAPDSNTNSVTNTVDGAIDDAMPNTAENTNSNEEFEAPLQNSPESCVEDAPSLGNECAENDRTEIGEIRVRLKYLDDTEKNVKTTPNTKIGDFKQKHFVEESRNNKIVRLIFAGHLLQNNSTIQDCRIMDNSVVHVQVLAAQTPQTAPLPSQDTDLNVGRFLWPIVAIILGLCWMTYFKYPEFYNSMSLGMLLLFSGFFFYFLSQAHQ